MVTESTTTNAPYAPSKAVLGVIERYRERGLPDPLTAEGLEQVGVAKTMTSRTLVALRFLSLVDERGNRMQPFDRLRQASTDEYPTQLAELVRAAYVDVFTIVDPSEDNEIAVTDAFRRYEPANQRDKMVALFYALCEESKIIEERTKKRRSSPRGARRLVTQQTARKRDEAAEQPPASPQKPEGQADDGHSTDYRLISAVIQQLPKDAKWDTARRQRWVDAMTSAVDLLVEVTEPATK